MRARAWTCGLVAVAIAVGFMVLPAPAGAQSSPLNSLTLDFIVDQSGLVVIDALPTCATYDDVPSPAERAVITDQVVDALRHPARHRAGGLRAERSVPRGRLSDPAAPAVLERPPTVVFALTPPVLAADRRESRDADPRRVSCGITGPRARGRGCRRHRHRPIPTAPARPCTDPAHCRTWVLHGDDAPVVVTTRVTTTGDYVPVPAARERVVLRCGEPSTGDPSFAVGSAIVYPARTLQALRRDRRVLVAPARRRHGARIHNPNSGSTSSYRRRRSGTSRSVLATDRARPCRRLTTPECKYYNEARPWTVSGIRIWGGPGGDVCR